MQNHRNSKVALTCSFVPLRLNSSMRTSHFQCKIHLICMRSVSFTSVTQKKEQTARCSIAVLLASQNWINYYPKSEELWTWAKLYLVSLCTYNKYLGTLDWIYVFHDLKKMSLLSDAVSFVGQTYIWITYELLFFF